LFFFFEEADDQKKSHRNIQIFVISFAASSAAISNSRKVVVDEFCF